MNALCHPYLGLHNTNTVGGGGEDTHTWGVCMCVNEDVYNIYTIYIIYYIYIYECVCV